MIRGTLFTALFILSMFANSATIEQSFVESTVFAHSYVKKEGGSLVPDNTRVTDLVNVDADTITLQEKTYIIPNKIGTGFELVVGFTAIPGDLKHFDLEITYPEMTLPSGERRSRLNRPIDISGHDGTYVWIFTYFFDFSYETSPGDWDIKIRSKGNLIHRSTFTVVNK